MDQKCECCNERLFLQWSDYHGVGVCVRCGLPYRIYHYAEGGKGDRIDKAPEVAIKAEWLPVAQRYWKEQHSRVMPGCYDMGIGANGMTYSGATQEDIDKWRAWEREHQAELPVKEG